MKDAKNHSLIVIICVFLLSPLAYALREVPDNFKGDVEKVIEKEEKFKKETLEKQRRKTKSQQAAISNVADSNMRQYNDYQYNIERTKKRVFIIAISGIAGFILIIVALSLLRKRLLSNVPDE